MSTTEEVLAAAASLVDAFGEHDTQTYFTAFSPDATFCFYTHPERLASRAEYAELWQTWEQDGFQVLGCVSSDQHVQDLGDTAVFTHRVSTRVRTDEVEESLEECETIVFVRSVAGGWVAVHEHLSPVTG